MKFDFSGGMPAQAQQAMRRWYTTTLIAILCLMMALVIIYGYTYYKRASLQNGQLVVDELKALELEHSALLAERDILQLKVQPHASACLEYLDTMTHCIPENVRLEKFVYDHDKKSLLLHGLARTSQDISLFSKKMHESDNLKKCVISEAKQYKPKLKQYAFSCNMPLE